MFFHLFLFFRLFFSGVSSIAQQGCRAKEVNAFEKETGENIGFRLFLGPLSILNYDDSVHMHMRV
jgi:hypothetical protein